MEKVCEEDCTGISIDGKYCWQIEEGSYFYYIDSTSNNPIETGTKNFPFKSMHSALAEIHNSLTNSSVEVTISVREDTINHLQAGLTRIVKIGRVKI